MGCLLLYGEQRFPVTWRYRSHLVQKVAEAERSAPCKGRCSGPPVRRCSPAPPKLGEEAGGRKVPQGSQAWVDSRERETSGRAPSTRSPSMLCVNASVPFVTKTRGGLHHDMDPGDKSTQTHL